MLTVMMNNGDESSFSPFLGCGASFNFYGNGGKQDKESDLNGFDEFDIPIDEFSSDRFRMYDYKVRKCARGRSHDWTDCPFAHPGEKARRRDPTKHSYSGTICPEFRKGQCRKGDGCEFAHGVFECWLHPSRYRTQPCKDGIHCRRPVCFFAHTPEQLRVVPLSEPFDLFLDSPPVSPVESRRFKLVSELSGSIRNLHLSPPSGGGFSSLPCTPTRYGIGVFDSMERVESGKRLREKMYARLSLENQLSQVEPDVGWVSELLG